MNAILGLDPGREKIGLAILDKSTGAILWRAIIAPADLEKTLQTLSHEIETVALGDSTASAQVRAKVEKTCPNWKIEIVDERGSTLEARELYWQANPPRGWRKLVPLSLQMPPKPLDDFAAAVIARRFLGGKT